MSDIDRARSLTAACELIDGHARGSAEGASVEALDDAAEFLRGRLKAWQPCVAGFIPRGLARAYDNAMRDLCRAAVEMHETRKESPL